MYVHLSHPFSSPSTPSPPSTRTHGRLFYINREAFEHFQLLKCRYHKATHRGGEVCVLDTSVIRQVTNKIRTDKEIFRKFQLIVSFDKRDVVNVC